MRNHLGKSLSQRHKGTEGILKLVQGGFQHYSMYSVVKYFLRVQGLKSAAEYPVQEIYDICHINRSASPSPRSIQGMKIRFFAGILFSLLLLAACENGPILSSYRPVLPELPGHWKEILGAPRWRLEWISEGGTWQEWEGSSGQLPPGLSLIQEWTTPVLAWPFWPARDLLPGVMRPAGALFPWDVNGDLLTLSWEGGAAAIFWKELAAADRTTTAAEGRLPWYLDWPCFRELVKSGNIPEAVRQDPWLADWKSIAQRTVQSGFDRRRIVSRSFTEITIPGLGGRWIGSSPFAPPLDAAPDGPLYLKTADTPDTWVSSGAVLKCSTTGWVLRATQ